MASTKIGALWRRTTQDGKKTFLSGIIQDIRGDIQIAVFLNDRKEKENQPDFNIVRSEQREEKKQQQTTDDFGFPNEPQEPIAGPEDEIRVENIPF